MKPLNIGIDIRDLRVAKTGTKTYLEELCKEFKKMNSAEICFHFLDSSFPIYSGDKKILKWIEHIKYQFWKQVSLPLKAYAKNCNIVFCTDNFVPIIHLGYKTIPVFHDAFFFETPEDYGRFWLWLYKKTAIPAAKRSAFVITPSIYSKNRIQHFTKITQNKLVVIYEAPKTFKDEETEDQSEQLLKSFALTPKNYILHVGSMFKRKNLPVLVTAFSKIKIEGYPELKLVLAGPKPFKFENDYQLILSEIEKAHLQNEVILTGYLSDKALNTLYKNALIYVFPSLNEGFGLPMLEAFEHDLPVLVSNNTCLPEVGGDAILQFDPFDTDAIFRSIKTVLDNQELQKEMVRKGRERLKDFSWEKTALQIVKVFKKAASG